MLFLKHVNTASRSARLWYQCRKK